MKIIRWILFLPAAFFISWLASEATYFANNLVVSRLFFLKDATYIIFCAIMPQIVSGGVFIYAGAYIVPNYNKKLILVLLFVVFVLFNILSTIPGNLLNFWVDYIIIIAGILSALFVCLNLFFKENN